MIRLQLQLFTTNILGCILPLPGKGINGAAALHRQSLTQIGLGIFGVIVQNIFKEAICFCPVTVLQSHIAPVKQRCDLVIAAAAHNHLFLYYGCILLLR